MENDKPFAVDEFDCLLGVVLSLDGEEEEEEDTKSSNVRPSFGMRLVRLDCRSFEVVVETKTCCWSSSFSLSLEVLEVSNNRINDDDDGDDDRNLTKDEVPRC